MLALFTLPYEEHIIFFFGFVRRHTYLLLPTRSSSLCMYIIIISSLPSYLRCSELPHVLNSILARYQRHQIFSSSAWGSLLHMISCWFQARNFPYNGITVRIVCIAESSKSTMTGKKLGLRKGPFDRPHAWRPRGWLATFTYYRLSRFTSRMDGAICSRGGKICLRLQPGMLHGAMCLQTFILGHGQPIHRHRGRRLLQLISTESFSVWRPQKEPVHLVARRSAEVACQYLALAAWKHPEYVLDRSSCIKLQDSLRRKRQVTFQEQ